MLLKMVGRNRGSVFSTISFPSVGERRFSFIAEEEVYLFRRPSMDAHSLSVLHG